MKKIGFENIKKTGKWALPVGVVMLGFVSLLAAAQPGGTTQKTASLGVNPANAQSQTPESPAPAVKPKITVNGTDIPTDVDGSTDVDIPGGKAHVDVSGGQTRVTTNDEGTSGDTSNSQSGNVNVNVDSHSDGGTNWGSTQVFGFNSSSDDSGTSFNSTSIFSTDSDQVSVSQH